MALSMSCSFHAPAEAPHELALIILVVGDSGHRFADAGRAHLEGIRDRQRRLLFECSDPAVPELRLVVEGVQNGRGVALADTAFDPDGGGPPVGERARGIMAGAARHGPVRRQATVEEQFLAEGDLLGGLRIVRRYRGARRGSRDADLMNGLRLSQRPGLGDRQHCQNGRTRPPNRERSGSQDAHERDAHRHGASRRGPIRSSKAWRRLGESLMLRIPSWVYLASVTKVGMACTSLPSRQPPSHLEVVSSYAAAVLKSTGVIDDKIHGGL